MPELMLVRHSSPDGQLPDSFPRLAQEPLSRRKTSFVAPMVGKKAPIYGKQKTSNGQRDQRDAQGRLGLIPSTKSECKTIALPGLLVLDHQPKLQ
jgi:hypothetical protein